MKILWTTKEYGVWLDSPRDVDWLPDSQTFLITEYRQTGGRVIEVNRAGEIVWDSRDKGGEFSFPLDADRLPQGTILIAEFGRVVEVTDAGDTVWELTGVLEPGDTEPTRLTTITDADRLDDGNTLIAESSRNRVIEVDKEGRVVWEYSKGLYSPEDADRLENGNTLIVDGKNNRVIEVKRGGEMCWQQTGLGHPRDADRLPNGNILITDTDNKRIIEVDSAHRIVWEQTHLNYPYEADKLELENEEIIIFAEAKTPDNYDQVVEIKVSAQ
ncbi:MAG: PQQ-binding-like beta-propeller repeat protein [bacterium]